MSSAPGDLTRRGFLSTAAGVGGTVVLALTLPGFGAGGKRGTSAAGGQSLAQLLQ